MIYEEEKGERLCFSLRGQAQVGKAECILGQKAKLGILCL